MLILQTPHRKEHEEELIQYQVKGTEVKARTGELYSEQGNTDLSELTVIDAMIQCIACKKHKRSHSARLLSRKDKNVEKYSSARHESLERS